MNFTLSLTHNCQLRCNYCYAGEKINKVMSKDTIDKSIEFLFNHSMDKLEYGFFGGEPLLELDKLKYATIKIEKMANEKDIKVNRTITTNALLLTEKNVKWLKEHLFYIVISLDGNEAMHNTHRIDKNGLGSFKKVIKNLKILQQYYMNNEYSINLVVTPQNVKYLSESVKELFLKYNIEDIGIASDFYSNWDLKDENGKNHSDIWQEEYKKIADFL